MHSFILLAQAITLSTCIVAHNNALLALLVSNNFAEIKSNVFKRVSKENLHSLAYYGELNSFYCWFPIIFSHSVKMPADIHKIFLGDEHTLVDHRLALFDLIQLKMKNSRFCEYSLSHLICYLIS